jgi:D-alanyl-D-alanine carboxypeptidase
MLRSDALLLLGCVSSLCLVGCSSSPSASPGPVVSPDASTTPDASADEGALDAPATETSSPACTARFKALKKGLDAAHGAKTNAVLALRDPTCGPMFVSSGPGGVVPTDLHRVGSVTKTYVTGVIMGLVSEGMLSLDHDVLSKWVTTIPSASSITIRQLLSHTAGVFNYTDDAAWEAAVAASPTKVWAPSELVAVAARNTPYFAPGQGWTYSNTDFILLGIIARRSPSRRLASWSTSASSPRRA